MRIVGRQKDWYHVELHNGLKGWLQWWGVRVDAPGELHGELIAIDADSVFLLAVGGLIGIPTSRIERAKLTGYNSQWGRLAAWTAAGTFSTLSHGFGLILSAPVWLVAGIMTSVAVSRVPEIKHPPTPWTEFRKYARFPQGLPVGLDRKGLKPKPWPR